MSMPEGQSERGTVAIGRAEIEDLHQAWMEYLSAADPRAGVVDPVLALKRTGAVLRSVERVLAAVDDPHERNTSGATQAASNR